MTEIVESVIPTKDSILNTAETTAEGLKKISATYPQTVDALYEIRLHDKEGLDDADSLTARQLVMDHYFGGQQNAVNLTTAIFDGKLKGIDPVTLQKSLDRFEQISNPNQSQEELLRLVQGEYNRNSVKLTENLSISHMKDMQTRNRYLLRAIDELRS